ncbi:MAG TPA: cytochrome c family protein [Vicinamibacterales bacterium]|jgi:cytochrome c|nr:cytochrome c family protein [Vicinamibacterales bacterium]
MRRLVRGGWLVVGGCGLWLALAGSSVRAADVENGKKVFEQCAACHSLDGTGDYDGPTLKGVIGRKAGSLEDYRYSAAMKRSDVTWDATTLDKYVVDPQAFIPGNRMAFAGIADQAMRDDLIAYLAVATKN